jgi:hypothetical protein
VSQVSTRRPPQTRTNRSLKPSLSPYFVDDIALTLADVLRARAADVETVAGR